jgi:hypothetical protein
MYRPYLPLVRLVFDEPLSKWDRALQSNPFLKRYWDELMAEPCGTDHRLDASKMLLSVRNLRKQVTPVEGQTNSTFGSSGLFLLSWHVRVQGFRGHLRSRRTTAGARNSSRRGQQAGLRDTGESSRPTLQVYRIEHRRGLTGISSSTTS